MGGARAAVAKDRTLTTPEKEVCWRNSPRWEIGGDANKISPDDATWSNAGRLTLPAAPHQLLEKNKMECKVYYFMGRIPMCETHKQAHAQCIREALTKVQLFALSDLAEIDRPEFNVRMALTSILNVCNSTLRNLTPVSVKP